ncbi:hypothetical protein NC661_01265 [Aquibacillus koreensis]|uniref:YceG-like family protein n=1 Tax=Aquibacillus koreensis TaxID=279446 RepID=A0A9X3WKY4_9BACI|nr:hypothetical protein [Aquibacillus koreensis]MCT2537565.1 hypothetical protein [Aquibacillus koreensis]MDC3419011.1 hypothetical protein [Aquibacillus koreensis]
MKQIIQAFSLGVFCATGLLALTYYIEADANEPEPSNQPQLAMTTEEMILELEKEGYTIEKDPVDQTESDESPDSTSDEPEIKEPLNEAEGGGESEEEEPISEQQPSTFNLVIEPGMNVGKIADQLNSAGLIEDPDDFISYLEENDYSTKIQIGEFEITSTNTVEEIAKIITN